MSDTPASAPSATAALDCIPCLCRETLAAVRHATDDPSMQQAVMGEALFHLAMRDPATPSPALAEDLRELIRQRTGRDIPALQPDGQHCPFSAAAPAATLSHENSHSCH